ncbi:MAG: diaminopimelate decarboxylase [Lachnospiraceae bacterium]|nr:diaminopimelate decarboxylase [Lachnospiraceae bacterium]
MEEQKIKEFAVSCQTPTYVFDTDILKERIFLMRELLRPAKLCFAIKANPFLLSAMDAQIDCYEVCSPGEFHICVQNGLDSRKIVLSGVSKDYEDVRYAMEQGVIRYTAESRRQFELVHQCAEELGKTVEILLRVTSGNQFGMSEADVVDLIRCRDAYPHLEVAGIQYFTGTQKKNIKKIAGEVEYIENFVHRLSSEEGFSARVLEFGPGLGVPYFTKDDGEEDCKLLEEFRKLFQEERPYELIFEMGRFLTASCGYYITKIVDQKRNDAVNVCIVDGGIHHVNYYGQNMAMKTPILSFLPQHPTESEREEKWTVYGSLCTVADVLLKNISLLDARVGDYLVFHNIGAYSVTEGIYLFLSRKMPSIYFYNAKNGVTQLRPELETWTLNTWRNE